MSIWLEGKRPTVRAEQGRKARVSKSAAREGVAGSVTTIGRLRERGAPGSSLGRNHDLRGRQCREHQGQWDHLPGSSQ